MHSKWILLVTIANVWCITSANAATTFLPDWQHTGLNFGSNEGDFNRDEPLCIEAVD